MGPPRQALFEGLNLPGFFMQAIACLLAQQLLPLRTLQDLPQGNHGRVVQGRFQAYQPVVLLGQRHKIELLGVRCRCNAQPQISLARCDACGHGGM